MSEGQDIERILQSHRHLGEREEGPAQEGHGHQYQASEDGHVLMRPGQQCRQHAQKGEGQAGEDQAEQKLRPDMHGGAISMATIRNATELMRPLTTPIRAFPMRRDVRPMGAMRHSSKLLK